MMNAVIAISFSFRFERFVESSFADFHASGSFANVEPGCQMLPGFGELVRCYDGLSAATPATFLRSLQPGARPLPDQVALELRQCPDMVEDQY
jgi:hypothetical protein